MYGWEDKLLNRFAGESTIWASNGLREKLNPVHVSPHISFSLIIQESTLNTNNNQVIDVGHALELMLQDDSTAGQTYELFGPSQYSMHEIYDVACRETLHRRPVLNIPKMLRKPMSALLARIFWATRTNPDLIEREFLDQVIDPHAKTFKDLGIEPVELKACTYEYLQGYRSNVYYDLPAMTEREKREEKKYYHVIDDQ